MRERYRSRYQAEGKAMGRLEFSDLEIEPLWPGFDAGARRLAVDDARWHQAWGTLYVGAAQVLRRMEDRSRPHVVRRGCTAKALQTAGAGP